MKYPVLALGLVALLPSFAFAAGHEPDFTGLPTQPSVHYDGPMVVGSQMPQDFTVYPVPNSPDYDYVVLNDKRVIVDHKTHTIYRILP